MLSENEKKYAAVLLSGLPEVDLHQLAKTVTNRAKFDSKTREEAIELILKYEEDVESLLNRKKVTRQLLCHYLHWIKAEFSPNDDKATLQATVIKLWESNQAVNNINEFTIPNSSIVNYQQVQQSDSLSESHNEVQLQQISTTEVSHRDTSQLQYGVTDERLVGVNREVSSSSLIENIQEMATKFSEWFYNLLNEDFWKRGLEVFSPDHLFQECRVVVKLENESDSQVSEATCAQDGAALLRSVCLDQGLLLRPNLSDGGVRGVGERHGAVLVLPCGTIHIRDDCVGVFEQVFSLVRDPTANDNWKIKHTEIRLKSRFQNRVPTLTEGELTRQLLPA